MSSFLLSLWLVVVALVVVGSWWVLVWESLLVNAEDWDAN